MLSAILFGIVYVVLTRKLISLDAIPILRG